MSQSLASHVCREKCFEDYCPICHEYIFTSTNPIKGLPCGHLMHSTCFRVWVLSHFSFPCYITYLYWNFILTWWFSCFFVFQDYTYSHYTCPICSKSLGDMQVSVSNYNVIHFLSWFSTINVLQVYFQMLDTLLVREKMPDEYLGQTQVGSFFNKSMQIKISSVQNCSLIESWADAGCKLKNRPFCATTVRRKEVLLFIGSTTSAPTVARTILGYYDQNLIWAW